MEFFGRGAEEKRSIEDLKKEEVEGLHRLYSEIVTLEILERNLERWKNHLTERLEGKYSRSSIALRAALKRAENFSLSLPIRHSTNYQALRASNYPYIVSNFMARGLGIEKDTGNSGRFDADHELDHFVYGALGVRDPQEDRRKEWNVDVYIKNGALQNEGALVALEDFGWGTNKRVMPQRYKGITNHSGPEIAFPIQLEQIWKGSDFRNTLLPMMLAYAYDKPEEFEREKPFPLDFVPEGLPRIADVDLLDKYTPEFPRLEVRIPRSIIPSDILAFVINEKDIKKGEPKDSRLVVVPERLSLEGKREFVKERLVSFQ